MDLCAPIKQTKGRQKIEIKKIEKKSNRMVTFSKRRMGLFRYASELSILCGAEIGILVQSPGSKIFSFGSYSMGSVLKRFHGHEWAPVDGDEIIKSTSYSKIVYFDAENRLEKDKGIVESEFCWDRSDSEIMKLDELEEHVKALEGLESRVLKRVNELKIESLPALINVDGDDDSLYLIQGGEKEDDFSVSAAVIPLSNSSSNFMNDNDASREAVSELTLMDSNISKSIFLADHEEGYYGSDFDSADVVFASNSSSNGRNDNGASWGAVSELTPMDSDISNSIHLTDLNERDYEKSDFGCLKHIFDGFVQEDNFDDSSSSFRFDPSFGLAEDSSDWDEFVKSV